MTISHIAFSQVSQRFRVHFDDQPAPAAVDEILRQVGGHHSVFAATIVQENSRPVIELLIDPNLEDADPVLADIKLVLQPRVPFTVMTLLMSRLLDGSPVHACEQHEQKRPVQIQYAPGLAPKPNVTQRSIELIGHLMALPASDFLPAATETNTFLRELLKKVQVVGRRFDIHIMSIEVTIAYSAPSCKYCASRSN